MNKILLQRLARVYMAWMGSIGNSMFYFQAHKIFTTHKAGDISFIGFSISVVALLSWMIYGIMIKDKPLMIANLIGVIGAAFVVAGIIMYG